MDPICHTLVGATLSRAGLDRWTTRATATLILGANAPDVDIVAAFAGRTLEWRRGWTHGLPALFLWPFVIAGAMVLWDRWRRRPDERPVSLQGLLLIAGIGTWTHPFLDYLNSYGMRWLMPLRDHWFYGDSLFIIDPWLYLTLGAGLWLSRRSARRGDLDPARPARLGLAATCLYVGTMIAGTLVARNWALRAGDPVPTALLATPVPFNPLARYLVADFGDRYRIGHVRFLGTRRVRWNEEVFKGDRFSAASAALARSTDGRAFLHWARFPAVTPLAEPDRVRVFDLRYTDGRRPSWAAREVSLDPTP